MDPYLARYIINFNGIAVRSDIEIHAGTLEQAKKIAITAIYDMADNFVYDKKRDLFVNKGIGWDCVAEVTIEIDEVYLMEYRWVYTANGEKRIPISESR